jgi:hypothetical protein
MVAELGDITRFDNPRQLMARGKNRNNVVTAIAKEVPVSA